MTTKTGLPIAVFFSLIAVFLFNQLLAIAKPADPAQVGFNSNTPFQYESIWNGVSSNALDDLRQPDSPPVLLSTFPISGATNVPATSLILATFSEPVTVTNFEIRYFNFERHVPGTYRAEGNSLIFTPTDPMPYNTTFSVILWHIADLNGNPFEGEPIFGDTDNYLWEFITEEEPIPLPQISLDQADYLVDEGGEQLDVTLALTETSAMTVSVDVATVAGSASEADYVPVADTIIFPAGTLTQALTIDIVDDHIDEPDETFQLTLSNPQNATLGTPSAATVTIIDNDAPPTLSFSAANYRVGEAAGETPITLTLSAVSGFAISADYFSDDVTAIAGEDYTAAAGTLNILAGRQTAVFTVAIINDTNDEPDETFNLILTNLNHAALGNPASAVVTILDDDVPAPPEISFEAADYTGIEEERIVNAVVTLSAPGSGNVSVAFNTIAGSATAEDFVAQSGVLSFTGGVMSQTISVELLDDDVDEPDETFSIVLSNAQNAVLVEPMTATVTIQDNDKPGNITVLINETDADQTGYDRLMLNTQGALAPQQGNPDDTAEYVELYDGGAGNTPLNGLAVIFYDGSNNASYAAFDLDGFSTDANGYFVLGNAAVSQARLVFADNLLQDGEDAVALYWDNASSFPNGTPVTTTNLIDAIVYETDNDPDSGLTVLLNPGQLVVDEWVHLPPAPENRTINSMPAANSLQRCPNGSGGLRNTSSYLPASPTPGGENSCPPRNLLHTPAFSVYLPLILR